jgi:hypothetical protein
MEREEPREIQGNQEGEKRGKRRKNLGISRGRGKNQEKMQGTNWKGTTMRKDREITWVEREQPIDID